MTTNPPRRKPRARTSRPAGPPRWPARGAWLLAVVLVLAIAGFGAFRWSASRQGRAALLAMGSGAHYLDVQAAVDGALAAALPGFPAGPAPACDEAEPAADCDWPVPGFGDGAAIRCRRIQVDGDESWWEVQARLAAALQQAGARVLWGERLAARRSGRGGGGLPAEESDALRLDVGVTGRPTHTLVLVRADRPRDVSWGGGYGRTAWADLAAGEGPVVALVIDDWGYSRSDAARRILELPAPLTMAVLPGLSYSRHFALQRTELVLPPDLHGGEDLALRRLRGAAGCLVEVALADGRSGPPARRREIMLHLPMQPESYPETDPGPHALMVGMDRETVAARVDSALAALPDVTGVNNHMGSAATSDPRLMADLMAVLAERGLFFVDSLTSSHSVGAEQARAAGLPTVENRIFLDVDYDDPQQIRANLERLVKAARRTGFALGIGHPHPATADVLAREIPRLSRSGVRFVTVSELLALQAAARERS